MARTLALHPRPGLGIASSSPEAARRRASFCRCLRGRRRLPSSLLGLSRQGGLLFRIVVRAFRVCTHPIGIAEVLRRASAIRAHRPSPFGTSFRHRYVVVCVRRPLTQHLSALAGTGSSIERSPEADDGLIAPLRRARRPPLEHRLKVLRPDPSRRVSRSARGHGPFPPTASSFPSAPIARNMTHPAVLLVYQHGRLGFGAEWRGLIAGAPRDDRSLNV